MSLLPLLLLVGVLLLWANVQSLKQRVQRLEKRLAEEEAVQPTADAARTPAPAQAATRHGGPAADDARAPDWPPAELSTGSAAASPPVPTTVPMTFDALHDATPRSAVPVVASAEEGGFSFVALLKRNLFAVAGVGLLLLGFAFLFRSVHWGDLLPPAARIALAWASAATLGYVGVRASPAHRLWGHIAQGGGAAVAYLATYVAQSSYTLFSEPAALVLFALVSAVLVLAALREQSKVLAGVGFLGAYAAPLLALSAAEDLAFNLGYGLLVSACALWISHRRRWIEIAVHAHLCAAGLAALTYRGHAAPLPPWAQQAFLHAYALQFGAWCTAWSRKWPAERQETVVLVAALSLVGVVYLALQQWLLAPPVFAVAAACTAAVFLVLGLSVFEQHDLREASFVLAALAVAVALAKAELSDIVLSLGLYAEGVVLLLTADVGSFVRRWIGRTLVVAGTVLMIDHADWWGPGLVALASFVLSLRAATWSQSLDGWLHTGVTAVATTVVAIKAELAPPLATALGAALYYALAAASLAARSTVPAQPRAVYALLAALGWVTLILQAPGSHAALQITLLALPPAALTIGLAIAARSDARAIHVARLPSELVALVGLQWPALAAHKLQSTPAVIATLALFGLVAYALFERRGDLHRLWRRQGPATIRAAATAQLAIAGSVVPLLPWAATSKPAWAAGGLAFAACWLAWLAWGDPVRAAVRRVACGTALLIGGYLCAVGLATSTGRAWTDAWDSTLLPVLIAAFAVACLFDAARRLDRGAWQASAIVCAASTVKLLASVGSASLSPLGIALSLLGMGALFLIAGYLAPLPPSRSSQARVETA